MEQSETKAQQLYFIKKQSTMNANETARDSAEHYFKAKYAKTNLTQEQTKISDACTLTDLLNADVPEVPRLYYPLFLQQGIAILFGGSDTGKSTFLRQMCMNVAGGNSFLGLPFHGKHRQAIYFSSEDDGIMTAPLVKRYNKTMNLPQDATSRLRFRFGWDSSNVLELVDKALEETPADLVVIDALADAFSGKNINDSIEVRKFYAPYKALAEKYSTMIIFLHHSGKRTDQYGADKANMLGSQALEAVPRLAMELRTDPSDETIKHLCIVKANYLGHADKSKSIGMKMDDNFVFQPTGEHKELSDLAKVPGVKRKTKPSDFAFNEHRDFIATTFNERQKKNQSVLLTSIMQRFEISRNVAKIFLSYYLDNNFIGIDGKGEKNATMYRSKV